MFKIMVAGDGDEILGNFNTGCAAMAAKWLQKAGADAFVSLDPAMLDNCDALVIPGGGPDIDPAYYGEEIAGSRDIDTPLDVVQWDIINAAMDRGMPMFGICRGLQFVNIAFGGTAIQDTKAKIHHFVADAPQTHQAWSVPGSFIEKLYGPEVIVNTAHHQALKHLADGMRVAQLWCADPAQLPEKLKAAQDGTLRDLDDSCIAEAVYHDSYPFLGTQWHPELNEFFEGVTAEAMPMAEAFLNMIEREKEK